MLTSLWRSFRISQERRIQSLSKLSAKVWCFLKDKKAMKALDLLSCINLG